MICGEQFKAVNCYVLIIHDCRAIPELQFKERFNWLSISNKWTCEWKICQFHAKIRNFPV